MGQLWSPRQQRNHILLTYSYVNQGDGGSNNVPAAVTVIDSVAVVFNGYYNNEIPMIQVVQWIKPRNRAWLWSLYS